MVGKAACPRIKNKYRHALVRKFLEDVGNRAERKGDEYNDPDDAYQDFRMVSEAVGITVEQVVLVYMFKHFLAVCKEARGHALSIESAQERLGDITAFSAVLAVFKNLTTVDPQDDELED